MDINDFRTFLEVSRTRHFGKAAINLCITQSTVSARIRQLEVQLDKKLFVRQRNNIQLTPAGEQLLPYAELITTAWSRAKQSIGLAAADRISLVVGGLPGLWDITIQDWLHRVYAENDRLVMHTEVHGTDILRQSVLNGTMDIAFIYDVPVHDDLAAQVISDIKIMLVTSDAGKTAETALAEKYILVDWGTTFLTRHAQYFPDIPLPLLHTGLSRIALEFILSRGGSAYLAEPVVDEYIKNGALHRVENAPVFERTAYAIYRKDNDRAELIQALLRKALVVEVLRK